MPRKEPLYPHVPKSREPVYPHEKSPSTHPLDVFSLGKELEKLVPGYKVEVFELPVPKYLVTHAELDAEKKKITIRLWKGARREDALALLAHEYGHVKPGTVEIDPDIDEGGAWERGERYAKDWGVLNTYIRSAVELIENWEQEPEADKMDYERREAESIIRWLRVRLQLPLIPKLLPATEKQPATDIMFFNVPKARDQLIHAGFVYTLRPKMRHTGRDTAVYGSYYKREKIADVQVDFIKQIKNKAELVEYLSSSGFHTVEDWWQTAKGSMFLFKVTLYQESPPLLTVLGPRFRR